jgi:adenylate kinase
MKTIVIAGIPGAGKSSILQEMREQIPTLSIVNYRSFTFQQN